MVEINEDEVRRFYLDDGLSMRVVAGKIEVPLATLSRFMKKHGITARDKTQAQTNFLKTHEHQMQGRKHSDETKNKISAGLGEFWDGLSEEEEQELRSRIGGAWKRKWAAMSDAERAATIEGLSQASKASQGKGSKLERFLAEELRTRGYVIEERTVHYTPGHAFEVDLALPREGILIEVDGPTHFLPIFGEEYLEQQQERDERKDNLLTSAGWDVLRVRDNNGPLSKLRVDKIEQAIQEIKKDGGTSVWYIE